MNTTQTGEEVRSKLHLLRTDAELFRTVLICGGTDR
jgi:hypothetical protein